MLTVISPAKKLDFDGFDPQITPTFPDFQDDAFSLSKTARRLSVANLRKLMSISEALAKLNQTRFKAFEEHPTPDTIKSAALAFAGDTYIGLEAATFDADEMEYAQNHLRILSGLYGLLRPMDQIQPYRLEMGSRLVTRRGKNLYQYWGKRLSETLNAEAEKTQTDTLLNCASVEYFTAVDRDALKLNVITPMFMEESATDRKIVSFYAKRARGAMARFVMQNRIVNAEGLKDFDIGGYTYRPDLSSESKPVFTRDATETG